MKSQIVIDALIAQIEALIANQAAPVANNGKVSFELIATEQDKKLEAAELEIAELMEENKLLRKSNAESSDNLVSMSKRLAETESKNRMLTMKLNDSDEYIARLLKKMELAERRAVQDENHMAKMSGEITTLHSDIFELQKQIKINEI